MGKATTDLLALLFVGFTFCLLLLLLHCVYTFGLFTFVVVVCCFVDLLLLFTLYVVVGYVLLLFTGLVTVLLPTRLRYRCYHTFTLFTRTLRLRSLRYFHTLHRLLRLHVAPHVTHTTRYTRLFTLRLVVVSRCHICTLYTFTVTLYGYVWFTTVTVGLLHCCTLGWLHVVTVTVVRYVYVAG